MVNAINIKTIDKPGVLRKVTDFLAKKNINIVYTHMFQDSTGYAHMYIELEDVIDIENLLNELQNFDEVFEVNISHYYWWGSTSITSSIGCNYRSG